MNDKNLVSLFDLFSPTDFRYNVEALKPYLSEEAFVQYKSKIEVALAKVLGRRGLISEKTYHDIANAAPLVTASEVYKREREEKELPGYGHDILSQVHKIREKIDPQSRHGVHKTATSFDIVDPANCLRYRDAFENVIIPDMISLEEVWIGMVKNGKDTLQIGRTHLQHAEPITFGFAMAWYVSRFGKRILKIKEAVKDLEGKFSGAVGAYNASYLFVDDPENFEREILAEVGLNPTEISTQITQPEPMTDLMNYVITAFGILANWADDMRNLQRPEIGEIGQPRGIDVSRSSTMPHKANPVGLENIKGLWKGSMPYMITMYLDQISEHQRDLTNSPSQRYVPPILDQFDFGVRRATRVSKNLKPHAHNMLRNFEISKDKIIAEPLHLLLSAYGHPDSHTFVGELVDDSYTSGKSLIEIILNNPELQPYLQQFTPKQLEIISNPSKYLGIAPEKAEEIAELWSKRLEENF